MRTEAEIRRALAWLSFRVRWWRWFLGGPSIYGLICDGWDKPSRNIILDRWDAKEPKWKP